MWYNILPGGHIAAFSTKGDPHGPTGYMQPAIKAFNQALQDPSSEWSSLVTKCNINAVLPIRDLSTGQAKIMRFASGTKTMNVSCLVAIKENVLENTEANGDAWCTMLVREINEKFDVRISFGGNAAHYGMVVHTSLDSQFLTEDVANLALMSYLESIEDGSFFHDEELVSQYFSFTTDVQGLFRKLFNM